MEDTPALRPVVGDPSAPALKPFSLNPEAALEFAGDVDGDALWILLQESGVVGRVTPASTGYLLETFDDRWEVQFGTGFWGWFADFVPVGRLGGALRYSPSLWGGSWFRQGRERRYRLRTAPFSRQWAVLDQERGELARIDRYAPAGRSLPRVNLGAAAQREPRIAVVILASFLVLTWERRDVQLGGGG